DQSHIRHAERPERDREVPAGSGRAGIGALAAPRRLRALSRAQGAPELPRPAGPARGDREPHLGGTPQLQPDRSGLQHDGAALSEEHHRLDLRLQGEGLLRGRRGLEQGTRGQILKVIRIRLSKLAIAVAVFAAVAAALTASGQAHAADWPAKPTRLRTARANASSR